MGVEWPQKSVGDITLRVTKGTTPTTVGGRFVDEGIAFVKVESITDHGSIDQEKLAYIDMESHKLLARSVLQEDDVLFTIAGSIGRVAKVNRDVLPANTNQAVAIVRPNRDFVDPRFLYYVLRDEVRVKQAKSRVVQSVQANFSLTELSSVKVPLPSMVEQQAIAHILGTLDDKIEINRCMERTLEGIVMAILRSWFVDFDPVNAKTEGRFSGFPEHIDEMIPDRFKDSEIGKIPDGWPLRQLRDVLNPKNVRVGDVKVPVYSSTNDGLQLRSKIFKKQLSQSIAKNKLITQGDMVFGLSRRILSFGLMRDPIGCVSPAYKVYSVEQSSIFPDLLERMMRIRPNYFYRAVSASSREGQSISSEGLGLLKIVQPPYELQVFFYDEIMPLLDRVGNLREESRLLANLRDTLLPRLVMGELRIDNVDEFLHRLT